MPGRHEEHADAGEEEQRVVLASGIRRVADEAHGREDGQDQREEDQPLEEEREVVDDERAREDGLRPIGQRPDEHDQRGRDRHEQDREEPDELLLRLPEEHREREDDQPARREEELRREEGPVGRPHGEGHGATVTARGLGAAPAPRSFAIAGCSAVGPPTAWTMRSAGLRITSNSGLG